MINGMVLECYIMRMVMCIMKENGKMIIQMVLE